MTSMNISLPDGLRAFVEEQVERRHFSSASEYLRELIRADQQRREQERLEALLLEGLDSGASRPLTEEVRREIVDNVARRLQVKI